MTPEEIDANLSADQSWIPQDLRDIGLINSDGSFRSPPPGPLKIDLSKNRDYLEYEQARNKRITELSGEDITEEFQTFVDNSIIVRKDSAPMNNDDFMMPWEFEEIVTETKKEESDEKQEQKPVEDIGQIAAAEKIAMTKMMDKYEKEETPPESTGTESTEPVKSEAPVDKTVEVSSQEVAEKPAEIQQDIKTKKKTTKKKESVEKKPDEDIVTTHHTPEELEDIAKNEMRGRTTKEFRDRMRELDQIVVKLKLTDDMTPSLLSARIIDISNLMIDIGEERRRLNHMVKGLFGKEGTISQAATLSKKGANELERKQAEIAFLQNYPSAYGDTINITEVREFLEAQQSYYNDLFEQLKALQVSVNAMVSIMRTEATVY